MKKISLISVYNNELLLKQMKHSAEMQKEVFVDYVLIDNRLNKFSSAAAALNYGITQVKSEVVVFLHQDIEFLDEMVLESIYDFAVSHQNTIFGAAGVTSKNNKDYTQTLLSSMFSGPNRSKNNGLDSPQECFTLDECLIACHRSIMNKLAFDEIICDGWHLYGADLCLQAQITDGLNVMAVPMNVWHKSNGNADTSYFITQNRLAKKYRGRFRIINTTNGYQYTGSFKRFFINLYRKIVY